MEQSDLESLIADLEVAIDRLRSLYDQYFMGIEKIEPAVARKDVDRRIHALRKEQIRNTALRFRFQMTLQRYNTFQSHWQRICREIENGTYKRHVLRAEQRFGKDRQTNRPSQRPPGPSTQAPAPSASEQPPAAAQGAKPRAKPEPGAPLPANLAAELAELDKEFAPPSAHDDAFLEQLRQNATARTQLGALKPDAARAKPPVPKPATLPGRAPSDNSPGPASAPSPPAAPALRAIVPPRPASPPASEPTIRMQAIPPRAPTAAPVPRPQSPPSPAPPRPAPPPAAAPPRPAAPAPRPAAPAAPMAPAAARPPTPAAPMAPPSARKDAPAPTRADEILPDARVRQLYVEYVEAKRRQNESTAAITYDAVATSLRASGAKLREKHGKSVDFEVTVRDGKAVLKPVLK